MKSIEMDNGGPLMPRSESLATVKSVVGHESSGCPMPGGDAGHRQLIVEPGGRAAAEVVPDRAMQRRQNLQQDEHRPHHPQRSRERIAAPDRAHQRAHRDGEQRREQPAQQEHDPPGD
jgi:hypothetical protein